MALTQDQIERYFGPRSSLLRSEWTDDHQRVYDALASGQIQAPVRHETETAWTDAHAREAHRIRARQVARQTWETYGYKRAGAVDPLGWGRAFGGPR